MQYSACTASAGTELGFRTFYVNTNGQKSAQGLASGGVVGVIDSKNGIAGEAPHGSQYFAIEKTGGFAYVQLDPVSVADYQGAQVRYWVHLEASSWEQGDEMKVWAADPSTKKEQVMMEETDIAKTNYYYAQISWAGGRGCGGNHNFDKESQTGKWCAETGVRGDHMRSRACNTAQDRQLFRMELLPTLSFAGKKNQKHAAGVYRLHSKQDDSLCLRWSGRRCAKYSFEKCKTSPRETDSQVFHLSKFTDDLHDIDVFNWASADGGAMDALYCNGYRNGNIIQHCNDDLGQAKRWQMRLTNVPLESSIKRPVNRANAVDRDRWIEHVTALPSAFNDTVIVSFGLQSNSEKEGALFDHFRVVGYGANRRELVCASSSTCTNGTERSYTHGAKDASCVPCAAGYHDHDSNPRTQCQPCGVGTYQSAVGSTKCLACPDYPKLGVPAALSRVAMTSSAQCAYSVSYTSFE